MRSADGLETIVRMDSQRFLTAAVAALIGVVALTAVSTATAADVDQPHFISSQALGLSGGPHGASAPATVSITKCASSPVLANRRFFVQAHMLPVTGTQTMQLRFRFFMKRAGEAETEVKVEGSVGYWEPAVSAKTTKNWIFNKQVDSLPAPGSFRMEVDFQWNGAGSKVVKRQTIRTGGCTQTDLRPDLSITGVTTTAAAGGVNAYYDVSVANVGKGTALASKLVLTVLSPYARVEVNTPSIKAGETKIVRVTGPRCDVGGSALIEVDQGNLLGEASISNNGRAAGCSPSA